MYNIDLRLSRMRRGKIAIRFDLECERKEGLQEGIGIVVQKGLVKVQLKRL
ncbi:hypothetical protein SAMN03003324_04175 [Pedobacter antarcticus]|uniref:Uncharacterized protein n=1 Tax=Pedobacter antarcticus TaxID=34086 RepID=A0A1I2J4Y2_9SPHI|nr:hypothetical protein SAMN03003324_04175 [Pedobacter antarcticus]